MGLRLWAGVFLCVFRVWEEAMTELGCIPLCGCGGGGWWCVSCRTDSLMGGYSRGSHHVWGVMPCAVQTAYVLGMAWRPFACVGMCQRYPHSLLVSSFRGRLLSTGTVAGPFLTLDSAHTTHRSSPVCICRTSHCGGIMASVALLVCYVFACPPCRNCSSNYEACPSPMVTMDF